MKYGLIVINADDHGEGAVFHLYNLLLMSCLEVFITSFYVVWILPFLLVVLVDAFNQELLVFGANINQTVKTFRYSVVNNHSSKIRLCVDPNDTIELTIF